MSYKTDYKIDGFYEYVVPPLERFWWQDGMYGVDYSKKDEFNWISIIRLPDFITRENFDWAVKTASEKKKVDCSKAEFLTIEEGLCVQIMHIGSFDDEPTSLEKWINILKKMVMKKTLVILVCTMKSIYQISRNYASTGEIRRGGTERISPSEITCFNERCRIKNYIHVIFYTKVYITQTLIQHILCCH